MSIFVGRPVVNGWRQDFLVTLKETPVKGTVEIQNKVRCLVNYPEYPGVVKVKESPET